MTAADVRDREQNDKQIARVLRDADQTAGNAEADQAVEPTIHPDRMRTFTHTSLSRVKVSWTADEHIQMSTIWATVDKIIEAHFKTAFAVQEQLYRHVRKPVINTVSGEAVKDTRGRIRWIEEDGIPYEDWLSLGDREREQALYQITTHMFEWEQIAAKIWGDAMFAKGIWEEQFAHAFSGAPGTRPTVDDKTHHAHKHSMEQRYFAIFQSLLSRRADAVVRSMTRLYTVLLKDARRA